MSHPSARQPIRLGDPCASFAPLIVMGVSGAGKSVIGAELAGELGWHFIDADDLHPPTNVAKMRGGEALNDQDRMPWLDAVSAAAVDRPDSVVACSALRRRYRERISAAIPQAFFIELVVPRDELERRLRGRSHPFMPSSLLSSQLSALETLEADERGVKIDASGSFSAVLSEILGRVRFLAT